MLGCVRGPLAPSHSWPRVRGAGVCVWARVSAAPRHSWLGCWAVCVLRLHPATPGHGCAVLVCVFGLGFRLRPATPGWGVGLCAWSACTQQLLAPVRGVGVCVWARLSAAPRHSWLGCWAVCVVRLHPATPGLGCAVWVCVFGLGFRLRPATPGWGAGLCVCSACTQPLLATGARCGCVCLGSGFGCAPPLLAGVLGCVCAPVLGTLSRAAVRVRVCVPCLAGSGGPASRARFGAPHLSFGRSWFALCLFGPLRAGVALFVVVVGFFFFFFLFPFSPSLRSRCVLLCVFSSPGCLGPWRLVPPPPFFFFRPCCLLLCMFSGPRCLGPLRRVASPPLPPPPLFFSAPPPSAPLSPALRVFGLGCLGPLRLVAPPPPFFCVLPGGAVLWCPVFFFVFLPAGGADFLLFPVGSGLRAGSGSFLFLCSACAVLCWCACVVALCSVLPCPRGAGWCFVLLPVVFVCLLLGLAVLCCLLVGPGGSWCRVSVACCGVSLGAVLRRVAERCAAWRCVVVRCVVSFCSVWCCRALCCALGRCPSSWGPVPSGAVFCLVPPRCVCFVVVCRRVVLFAVVLCAVCALGCRVVRFLSSPPCAVLLCGPLSLGALLPCAVPRGAALPRGAVVSCSAPLLDLFLAWVWFYLLEKPLQNFVKYFFFLFFALENKIKLYTTQHTRVQQDHVRCSALRVTRRS